MEDSYSIALLIGAVVLFYQAWREYSNSDTVEHLKSRNRPERTGLEKVRMSALTTDAEYKRGRLVYIFGFFLLYGVLINFPEVAKILIPGNGEASVEGGAEVNQGTWLGNDEESEPAFDGDSTMPILVAIAMVVGVASPTFKILENAIRSVAYAFSGVPRNIYRVLDNLEELPYEDFAGDAELPLHTAFEAYLTRMDQNDPPVSDDVAEHLGNSLMIIDLLRGPIIGPQRNVFSRLLAGEAPLERIDELRLRYNQIRDRIIGLHEAEDQSSSADEILQESTDLAGSMQTLFAVFAIRNRRSEDNPKATVQDKIIRDVTDTGNPQSINDVMIAAIFGALFGGVLIFAFAEYLVSESSLGTIQVDATHKAVRNLMWPLLPSMVLFSVFTMFLRHVKFDQGSWKKYNFNSINFYGYVQLLIWPTFVALVFYASIMTITSDQVWTLLLAGEISEARAAGANYLSTEARQFPRLAAILFFFGCGLLFVADQHQELPWHITVLVVGSAISGILVIVAILFHYLIPIPAPDGGIISNGNMSSMLLIPFIVTIFFYASAAEFAESAQGRHLMLQFKRREKKPDA